MSDLTKQIEALSPQKRALFELLLKEKETRRAAALPKIIRRHTSAPAPLSFAQQRLWFLQQLDPDISPYNNHAGLRLKGALRADLLKESFARIVARHEALRTTFNTVDGLPMQAVAPAQALELPIVDLSGLAEEKAAARVRELSAEEAWRPFDLTTGPLLRTTLLRLAPQDHVLLLTMHHIVSDGLTMKVFIGELAALYQSLHRGEPTASLPELPVQYADYAVWQRDWLRGEVLEEQLAYWRRQLAGAGGAVDLPTDRPRPPVQTFNGAKQVFTLGRELTSGLRELSRQEGATLFMTLLAAFNVLLQRYTGAERVSVGSPVANRTLPETENLIGVFINTLVLSTNLDGDPTFRELLSRVRRIALDAYAHQDLPFERLVEELVPDRDLSRTPLFQVLFVFLVQGDPVKALQLPGLDVTPLEQPGGTAKFDLTLEILELDDELRVAFEYSTDLFDHATITRLEGHFRTLLEAATAAPDRRLSSLPLLTETERRQSLVGWNSTARAYPEQSGVHQLFERQAMRTPEAVALVCGERQLTYDDLNVRANRLANFLQSIGVGTEMLVGIMTERTPEMLIGMLGVLKAGAAYVPLDPTYPRQRLTFMLQHSRVGVLLCDRHSQREIATPHGTRVVRLDADWEEIERASAVQPQNTATPHNLAYVIYTSGSTGEPKGVAVEHRAVVNFLDSMRERPGLSAEDTLLAVTTLSFDIAALELFLPLTVGARLMLASRELAADGEQLRRTLDDAGVTVMQATPATWWMLLAAGWQGNGRLKILCGGEALPRELVKQLSGRCREFWNMYGPTETTIWSATCRLDEGEQQIVSIGQPIGNTQIYLLDAQLNPVPLGVAGELYIGGAGLARGYVRRPGLTAARFVTDPFSGSPGARLYRTGDLVRRLPGGELEFLGRADQQVKVRGFRVELGEIEAALSSHPLVRAASVVAHAGAGGDSRLAAYLVYDEGEPLTAGEWREYLRERLPEYMLPSVFARLDELPLTPNGKVDRRALPPPEQLKQEDAHEYVAPRGAVEEVVAGIWADTLGVKRVGVTHSFFELGGHSLLATQVVSRVREVLGVDVGVRTLFETRNVADFTAAILRDPEEAERAVRAAQLLLRLTNLSEDELEAMLNPD